MGDIRQDPHAERFGHYLRRVRESKKLSLDAVEEMAMGYPDRLTKSHLSRIENGLAEPTFRRLYSLSQIYGVPVTTLAERFELDLHREQLAPLADGPPSDAPSQDRMIGALVIEGRYLEALGLLDAILDEGSPPLPPDRLIRLRNQRINCLLKLDRVQLAKQEAEGVLDDPALADRDRAIALYLLAATCIRLERLTIGRLAIDRACAIAEGLDETDRLRGDVAQSAAKLASAVGDHDASAAWYEKAVQVYGRCGKRFEEVRATRNLASKLIDLDKTKAARRRLVELMKTCETEGYERQMALCLGDLGVIAWKERALESCETYLVRSNAIARKREYLSLIFRNCFYLWKVAGERGDVSAQKLNLGTLKSLASRVDHTLSERAEFLRSLAEDQ